MEQRRAILAVLSVCMCHAGRGPSGNQKMSFAVASNGKPSDYTVDTNPTARHLEKDFDHPYPIVQESDAYEKDFVSDENKDNGEWQAQFEYDKLRRQLLKEIREMEEAGRKLYGEDWDKIKNDLNSAKGGYKGALEAQAAAKKALEAAEERVKQAKAKVKQAEADAAAIKGSDDMPMQKEVAAAEQAVKDAEARVAAAEKKLAEAQQNLSDMLDKQQKAAAAQDAKLAKAVSDASEKLRAAQQERDAALAEKEAAQALLNDSLGKEDKISKTKHVDEEEEKKEHSNHDALQAAYDKELADVNRVKALLDAAAKKVKALRDGEDNKGGVTQVGHSGPGAVSVTNFWRSSAPKAMSPLFLVAGVLAAFMY